MVAMRGRLRSGLGRGHCRGRPRAPGRSRKDDDRSQHVETRLHVFLQNGDFTKPCIPGPKRVVSYPFITSEAPPTRKSKSNTISAPSSRLAVVRWATCAAGASEIYAITIPRPTCANARATIAAAQRFGPDPFA